MTNITIPNSVIRIDESAFYDCSGLTSIMLSASVRVMCECWEAISEPEPTEQENTEVKANKNNGAIVATVAGTSGVAGVTAIGTIVGVVLKKRCNKLKQKSPRVSGFFIFKIMYCIAFCYGRGYNTLGSGIKCIKKMQLIN